MRCARAFYRIALRAYPAEFRRRYADEMERVFADGVDDALRAGRSVALRYGLRIVGDLAVSAARERFATLEKSSIAISLAAVVCGGLIAKMDLQANEVQPTLLSLIICGSVLGLLKPRGAWRWALIMSAVIPAVDVIVFALSTGDAGSGHPYLSRLMILLPALAASLTGAYAAVFLRVILAKRSPPMQPGNDSGPAA